MSALHPPRCRILTLWIAGYAIALALVALVVVGPISGPVGGLEDESHWEFVGYFFSKNIQILPVPHLTLTSNQTFYPYGTSNVFLSWGFERDYYYTIMSSAFGDGPWLQVYFLTSLLVTAIGALILLSMDWDARRAGIVAFLLTFFNFFVIHKYPFHLNIATVHWMTLSLVVDYMLVRRVVLHHWISLRFLLITILFLVLSMGLELGYIAGFALMSFVVSIGFIVVLLSARAVTNGIDAAFWTRYCQQHRRELTHHPATTVLLASLIVAAAYFYVPPAYQIAHEALKFDFSGHEGYQRWANPLRVLIPVTPHAPPSELAVTFLQDRPEGFNSSSPGWFLLTLAAIGVWHSRKQIIALLPLIFLLLICITYHPSFPLVKELFPWLHFLRSGGRMTVLYAPILSLMALGMNPGAFRLRRWWIPGGVLLAIGVLEFSSAYWTRYKYEHYAFKQDFFEFMNYVRNQPGEAILDWPFCIASGNGVGDEELCPYYDLNNGIANLQRFHHKKTVGQYFGRLHPKQIEPFLEAEWDRLFSPTRNKRMQSRCLNEAEWDFFSKFFLLNDFAGINLYTELMSPVCVLEFHGRFGTPAIVTRVPGAGNLEFIPKNSSLKYSGTP